MHWGRMFSEVAFNFSYAFPFFFVLMSGKAKKNVHQLHMVKYYSNPAFGLPKNKNVDDNETTGLILPQLTHHFDRRFR